MYFSRCHLDVDGRPLRVSSAYSRLDIDRAEAGGGPWGAQRRLNDDQSFLIHIGPHRLMGHAAAGAPPPSVHVDVERSVDCPDSTIIDDLGTSPQWLWVSTEALRQQSFRPQAEILQVAEGANRWRPPWGERPVLGTLTGSTPVVITRTGVA